ncbi:hypothetical protein ACVWWK_000082 [Bradyrhizobium sp. LB9.1b]
MCIIAMRRHLPTISSFWFKAWCSNSTMPALGRDLDSRNESTFVVARKVSPWKTGFGKVTSVMPRLATVVPHGRIIDRHADHDAEGVKAVENALAELGLGRKMRVDVQRLRVERQQAEHGVVHLRDGPAQGMPELLAHGKILEIESGHRGFLPVSRFLPAPVAYGGAAR